MEEFLVNKFSSIVAKSTLFLLIFVFPVLVFAASEASVIFLLIEPGSRPGGMGQAYVAQVDDGFAQYWNPGAMSFNRKNQFALMHSNWFGSLGGDLSDMYYEYFGWNKYFEELQGNLGFNLIFLTYGTQEKTDETGKFLGTFTSYELALGSTYGYQYSDNLGLGLGFKIIWSDLSPEGTGGTETGAKGRGLSYAFDLAFLRKNFFLNGLSWGINLQNVGPNITYVDNDQSDPLPMNFRMGLSYRIYEDDFLKFTANADMNKMLANNDWVLKRLVSAWYDDGGFMSRRERESTILGFGGEMTYLNLLSGRIGFLYDEEGKRKGVSFGAGIQHTFAQRYLGYFNFAMEPAGELTDYNHTFSLGIEF